MKIFQIVLFSAAAALPSGAVLAQDSIDTVATLGFSSGSFEGNGYTTASLGLFSDLRLSNGFGLETTLGFSRNNDDFGNVDLSSFGIAPTFAFGGGYKVGAYFSRTKLDDGIDDISLTNRGVILGYEIASLDIESYYGTADTDPALVGLDIKDMGLKVVYDVSNEVTLGGTLSRTKLKASGVAVDVDGFGIAATYAVNSDVQIFGGLQQISMNDFGFDLSATNVGLGIAYNLPGMSGLNPNISLELVHNKLDDGITSVDGNEVRFGLTIPFGNASSTPRGSVAANVINSERSSLSPLVLSAF